MAARSQPKTQRRPSKRWSQEVTRHSGALDLKKGVFTLKDPKKIAASLKRSALASTRRKSEPINRAGKRIDKAERARREKAKDELRKA